MAHDCSTKSRGRSQDRDIGNIERARRRLNELETKIKERKDGQRSKGRKKKWNEWRELREQQRLEEMERQHVEERELKEAINRREEEQRILEEQLAKEEQKKWEVREARKMVH